MGRYDTLTRYDLERLDQIEERLRVASPEDWRFSCSLDKRRGSIVDGAERLGVQYDPDDALGKTKCDKQDNFVLIAHARQDLPWLAQLLREQSRELLTLAKQLAVANELIENLSCYKQIGGSDTWPLDDVRRARDRIKLIGEIDAQEIKYSKTSTNRPG